MKIVQIMPGFLETYYCENCLRDNSLVRAFRQLGHDVLIVPLYMPAHLKLAQPIRQTEIFLGGINVYLQHKIPLFRKTPRWLDRLFDANWLLKKISRAQGMTSAAMLGSMTLSMLQGKDGHQSKEIRRLVQWLKDHEQPDVICLSNALLLGLSPALKNQLDAALVCMLQDEEPFLDAMGEPYREKIWSLMAEQARSIDLFVSNCEPYTRTMQNRLQLETPQITTINTAIHLDDYPENSDTPANPTLGYLSRVCEEKGLDLLIDAFLQLKKRPDLKNLRLCISGDQMSHPSTWLRKIHQRLETQNCCQDVDFIKKFELADRLDFFRSISVLCVPKSQGDTSGFNILEAQAMAIPVVQPDVSDFPTILKNTPAAIFFKANDVDSMIDALFDLLTDDKLAKELGQKGRPYIARHFNILPTAQKWIQQFQQI